jgi:hypothetical protein
VTASPRRDPRAAPPAPDPSGGEDDYANAFAAGYGEGLRESLREMLANASRGYTASELRMLIQSRLARVPEDVDLKRKSLTGPPRRPAWGALLRRPGVRPPAAPEAAEVEALPAWSAGRSYLFNEQRPDRGPRFVASVAARHRGVVWVSHQPAPVLGLPEERVLSIRPSGGAEESGSGPGGLAGQITGFRERAEGPVLVYTDALEYFLTEAGTEVTVRFAVWLPPWAQETGSTAVVSLDAPAMEERDYRRVQRAYSTLA